MVAPSVTRRRRRRFSSAPEHAAHCHPLPLPPPSSSSSVCPRFLTAPTFFLPPPNQFIDLEGKLQAASPIAVDAEIAQLAIIVATSLTYGVLAAMVNKARQDYDVPWLVDSRPPSNREPAREHRWGALTPTKVWGSEHPIIVLSGGSLLPSVYADARYIDDVIV